MRSVGSAFINGLSVVAILAGFSIAEAQEYKEGSLDKLTQVGFAGTASFNNNQDLAWMVDTMALNYVMPHLGVGGVVYLNGGNRVNLQYAVGPMVEYFIPVANSQHVFGQAAVTVAGVERADSNFGLGASLGYRYFVAQGIAISARINRNWAKANQAGSQVQAIDATNLLIGFSVFF